MKRKKIHILTFILTCLALIISGKLFVNNTYTQTGQIIRIDNSSIWIVDDYSKDIDIASKTEDELEEIYRFQGIVVQLPWYIPNSLIEKLELGHKVKIFYNGKVRLSAPSRTDAYWFSIISD